MVRKYVAGVVVSLFLIDQLVLVGALLAALWLKQHWILADPSLPVQKHLDVFLRLWPFLALGLMVSGVYDLHIAVGRIWPLIRRTMASSLVLAGVWVAGTFYLKMSSLFEYSRAVVTLYLALATIGLIAVRLGLAEGLAIWQARTGHKRRVIVFGGKNCGRKLVKNLERQVFVPIDIVGATDEVPDANVPRLTEAEALQRLRQGEVDHVIVDLPPRRIRLLLQVAETAELEGVPMQITPSIFPGIHLKPRVDRIGRIPVIELCGGELPLSARVAKRMLDITLSLVGLFVLSPLMLLIAAVIKLTSPGPVLYVQERIGLDGRRFRMYKFRSMNVDAEAGSGPVWATQDDPRRTRLGKLLRRTNLDELPQLFNVLTGTMSLVGPRPERPEFVEQFKPLIERYSHKHWVKPGITGWAQVNGWRGQTDLQTRIEHDIYYIERWSLWLDIRIILKTLAGVYRNAY